MTQREFLTAITAGTTITAEMIEFAANEIAKMDAANAKRKEKVSKAAIANAPIMDRIVDEILGTDAKTATDIAAVLEVSVQKASSLLRALVNDGRATQTEVKVAKKGMQKGYTLLIAG